jgi:predicted  nucleic acid-binding Zn-ribbon protein
MTDQPQPDWDSIRARYEQGEEKVKDIAASAGLKPMALSLKAKALGWILRKSNTSKATYKSESTRATLRRLKDILQQRVASLEREINEIGKDVDALTSERDIRSMNTLVRTLDKVLELERKDRNNRLRTNHDFKRFSDEERGALADKLERLHRKYETEEAVAGTALGRNGGTE